jgi:heme-degrading monooxygenase HmoA
MHVVEWLARCEKCELERRHAVYARVSTLEGPPELMDEGLRQAREVVLPQGRLMDGFKGMIALGDRHSGKTLGITFWESEEAMRASEEAANRLRKESAKAGGDTLASVERYEVGLFEVEN